MLRPSAGARGRGAALGGEQGWGLPTRPPQCPETAHTPSKATCPVEGGGHLGLVSWFQAVRLWMQPPPPAQPHRCPCRGPGVAIHLLLQVFHEQASANLSSSGHGLDPPSLLRPRAQWQALLWEPPGRGGGSGTAPGDHPQAVLSTSMPSPFRKLIRMCSTKMREKTKEWRWGTQGPAQEEGWGPSGREPGQPAAGAQNTGRHRS